MKKSSLIIHFLTFGIAGFASQAFSDSLVCQSFIDPNIPGIRINYYNKTSFSHVSYNFSTASLQCVDDLQSRIDEGKPFKCVGIWSFDWILEDPNDPASRIAVDTVVEVDVESQASAGWQAHFVSNHMYGRKEVDLNCHIERANTP